MPNPSGLYSRIKTWGTTDVLLASDLNAEFDNVLSNFNPEMLAGYSQNQAQMQIQTSPGGVGSESLATSLSGELERIRYMINSVTGNTYWYQTPSATISQLNSALGAASLANKISSGLTAGTTGSVQPVFLLPANATNTVTLKASVTPFVYTIAGTTYTISADVSASSLTVAPASQNTATVADLTLPQAGTQSNQLLGENGSQITVSAMGTSVTAQSGNICAFKTTAGEYLLGRVSSSTQITQVSRGFFFNSSNALVSRGTLSNGDTLTLLKLTWIFATTAGAISPVYTNPRIGGTAPSSPATGDYWFDTAANIWKTYNSTSWVAANATLIGICVQDTTNTIGARSFDFFAAYQDTNSLELLADQANSPTTVRARYTRAQLSVYGTTLNYQDDYARWDFSTSMDTGAQAASTQYYFYIDTNGRTWISKVAPLDRRGDLKGYYHPGLPWRCVGYGYSNAATQLEFVESFYRSDDNSAVANITASNNNIILPYNISQREVIVTLTGAAGAFTQILPPPAQLKGKYLTYVRTDNTPQNAVTIQSWGQSIANPTGTVSQTTNPTVITGISSTNSLVIGQLITGPGILPNTTLASLAGGVATMSAGAQISITGGTWNFANAAGFSGTVGQQPGYLNYGINGFFTTTLMTQYETVTITSDGYAYFIKERQIPQGWFFSGTTNITAVTTAPIKGAGIISDIVSYKRRGNTAICRYNLAFTTAGTAGTGDYVISLPTNLTADTNLVQVWATAGTLIGTAQSNPSYFPATGYLQGQNGTNNGPVLNASLYSTTQFRIVVQQNLASVTNWGSASNPAMNQANCAYGFEVQIPILNWAG